MDWLGVINFLGKDIVIALIFCCAIILLLIGIYFSCCFCSHRQRGRLRPIYKTAKKPQKSDYLSCSGDRQLDSPLRLATAPPLIDAAPASDIYRLSITDSQNIGLASSSLIQPVIHSTNNYKDRDNMSEMLESPPAYDQIDH